MKDWQRSPEPPSMMGAHNEAYSHIQGNWGPPEEFPVLNQYAGARDDFDPAAPLSGRAIPALQSHEVSHLTHSTQIRPALSLYTMCQRVILRNLVSVQDLGDMPYRNAKPILEACRVDQLIALEEASPHLLEHSEEIWRRNCLQDFLELRKKYGDSQDRKAPKSWRKLYFKTQGQIEQAKVEAAQRIKDKYAQHKAEKDSKRLVVSDRPLMKVRTQPNGSRKLGATGGASKGQSLLNKARSGSAAQAKLTAPRNARQRSMGRSQATAAELVPAPQRTIRPMFAPRKIAPTASDGLAKMREFVKPIEIDPMPTSTSTSSKGKIAHSAGKKPSPTNNSNGQPQVASPPSEGTRNERKSLDFFVRKPSHAFTNQVGVRGVKRRHEVSVPSPPMSPSLSSAHVVSTKMQRQGPPQSLSGASAADAIEVRDEDQDQHETAPFRPFSVVRSASGQRAIGTESTARPLPTPNATYSAANSCNKKTNASSASLSSIFAPASSRGRAGMLSQGASSSSATSPVWSRTAPPRKFS